MIKRLGLILAVIFLMFSSVNAVEYLNSCGKNSGWTSGETYIINFTEIPNGYGNNYCFYFDTNLASNTTIKGLNQTLVENKDSTFYFFDSADGRDYYFSFKDLNYENSEGNTYIYNLDNYLSEFNPQYLSSNLSNLFFKDVHSLAKLTNSGQNAEDRRTEVVNSNFNNVLVISNYLFSFDNSGNNFPRINNNNFTDFYIYTQENEIVENINSVGQINNNNFINSVIVSEDNSDIIGSVSSNIYNDSIITKYPVNDSDDDNLADTDNFVYTNNQRVHVELEDYNFFQDVEEGSGDGTFNFVNDKTKPYIFLSVNESYEAGEFVDFDDNTFSFPIANNITDSNHIVSKNVWTLSSGSILDCSLLNTFDYCYFDNVGTEQTTIDDFRGMLVLDSNTAIYNTFTEQLDTDTNNNHIFSTASSQESNMSFKNNTFRKSDGLSGTEQEFLKLYTTSLDFSNNIVEMDTLGNPANVYNFMNIQSTTSSTNEIYNNSFTSTGGAPTTPHKIFSLNCDTKFYNNYVGENVTALNYSCGDNFNATPLVPYTHTNGNIYYFKIGNYYEDNNACTDADVDGICDSAYVGSQYTDSAPLSSYPFDFSSNILNAEITITNTSFNINLLNPTDNQTITLSSSSDTISLSFTQDSDYPDLKCDYVLDGSVVDSETNTPKSSTQTSDLTSWTEKSYTYRVECYNSETFQQSDEITFNVVINEDAGNGGNGGDDDNGFNTGIFNPAELFGGDSTASTNQVTGIMSYISQFYGILIIVGIIVLFVALLILILNLPYLVGKLRN